MIARLLVLLLALAACGCAGASREGPTASNGVLDLRDWNFERDGPVSIAGDWDFHWGELLGPDVRGGEPLKASGLWTEVQGRDGKRLGAIGYGTYRLRVLLPPQRTRPELALRVRAVLTAHRLWLGDQEFVGAGKVDPDLMRSIPATPNRLHVIPGGDEDLLITLQVENSKFRLGGIRKPFQIATVEDAVALHTDQVIYDTVIFTLLLTAGGYFLLIFAVRRIERYRLWFGLLCEVTAIRATVAGESLLADILMPGLPWETQIRIEYAANFIGCALIAAMIDSLYREHSLQRWLRLMYVVASVMFGLVLVLPVTMVVKVGPVFDVLAASSASFMVVVLMRATRAGKEHAALFLLTIAFFAFGMALDILRANGYLHSPVEFAPALFATVLIVQAMILARSFTRTFSANEKLSGDLGTANADLHLTNEAVRRFVPFEFLSLLQRTSIRDVARGDSTAMELEILFCDLRDFTSLVERLQAREAFGFINDWLAHMEPVIHRHQGFVNQYLGDCIMALFVGGADKALRAGIEMLGAVDDFNRQRSSAPGKEIRVGIGLNTGPIMLGTIGGKDRLDNGVVGDAVNVASRVESMTKLYGTPMLITNLTRDRLADPHAYALRELDHVAVMGKSKPITIFEVLDGLPTSVRVARMETGRNFSAGIEAYRRGHFVEAKKRFEACLAVDRYDEPARLYVRRCSDLIDAPPPLWDGVSVLTAK